MSQRQITIIGCVIAGVILIALCCGAGAFLYMNANQFITAFQTSEPSPTAESFTPVAESSLTATLEPDSTLQPNARATVSPRIPFPTPYSIATRYPATLAESYDVQPYSVSGNTPQEIRRALDQQGPFDESGRRFDSDTRWQLDGNWNWQPTARGCEVKDAILKIQITLVIPTLAVIPSITGSLLSGWNHYIERLKVHEGGHIDMDLTLARKLRDDFANFPPAFDCNILQSQLQARFDSTSSTIKQLNIQYDNETNHGATQGAVYP